MDNDTIRRQIEHVNENTYTTIERNNLGRKIIIRSTVEATYHIRINDEVPYPINTYSILAYYTQFRRTENRNYDLHRKCLLCDNLSHHDYNLCEYNHKGRYIALHESCYNRCMKKLNRCQKMVIKTSNNELYGCLIMQAFDIVIVYNNQVLYIIGLSTHTYFPLRNELAAQYEFDDNIILDKESAYTRCISKEYIDARIFSYLLVNHTVIYNIGNRDVAGVVKRLFVLLSLYDCARKNKNIKFRKYV